MVPMTYATSIAAVLATALAMSAQVPAGCERQLDEVQMDPDDPPPHERVSFGYIVGEEAHGCNDVNDCWVVSRIMQIREDDSVVRVSPRGDWLVYVPPRDWGRPASATSAIAVLADEESNPIQLTGFRFLNFIGLDHFLVSDAGFDLHIVGRDGVARRLTEGAGRPLSIGGGERIAAKLPDLARVGIWPSYTSFVNEENPLAIVKLDIALPGESIVEIQLVNESLLAIELGAPLGGDNRVLIFDVVHDELVEMFANSRLLSSPTHDFIGVVATEGGRATLVSQLDNNKLAKRHLDLREQEWVSSISPDGRFMIVASHRGQPPSAPPRSSVRSTTQTHEVLHQLMPGSRFPGWYLCDCARSN